MIDNEANAAKNPEPVTASASKGIPLASAFHRAAAVNSSRAGIPLATLFRQVAAAVPDKPGVSHAAVSPRRAVVVRHRQRVLHRSVAFRTRQRLIGRRFTRRDCAAAARARRPRSGEWAIHGAMRLTSSASINRIIESAAGTVMAPVQQMLRRIAEMVCPSGLRVMQGRIQRLVRNPMLDALRRVQAQIAAYAWPNLTAAQRIRDEATGGSNLFMGALRWTRDLASGFMTYQAKLQQRANTMSSSWSWKLPAVDALLQPITNKIMTIVQGIEWPGQSSMAETIARLAIRGLFWAAVRARKAILHEENSEEIVRDFMRNFLGLSPQGKPHVEAAKEALLEDGWLTTEPQDLKKVLHKKIKKFHHNHRLIGTTELGHHHIVSLETPSGRAVSDSGKILTLGEALADPRAVEDLVLASSEFRDHRIDRVLNKLKPGEREVANLYALHDGMTWERAAAAAGQPPAFGESVRRKLHRLGNEFNRRQPGGLHVPSTGPRTVLAFG